MGVERERKEREMGVCVFLLNKNEGEVKMGGIYRWMGCGVNL